jgi:hypothetical protein
VDARLKTDKDLIIDLKTLKLSDIDFVKLLTPKKKMLVSGPMASRERRLEKSKFYPRFV